MSQEGTGHVEELDVAADVTSQRSKSVKEEIEEIVVTAPGSDRIRIPNVEFLVDTYDDRRKGAAVLAELASRLELLRNDEFQFCWIVDYPMFEKDEETGEIEFSPNPFSMPQGELDSLESSDPLDIIAFQYDLVCNGVELSSGAIRNHRPEIMYKAFEIAGYEQALVDQEFGGMINAFKLGAPPMVELRRVWTEWSC